MCSRNPRNRSSSVRTTATLLLVSCCLSATSFHQSTFRRRRHCSTAIFSSVGDGPPIPPNDDNDDDGDLDGFLNPNNEESDALRRAREYMSEESLPLSYKEDDKSDDDDDDDDELIVDDALSSALAFQQTGGSLALLSEEPSADLVKKNPYLKVVSKLTPSELISKFTTTAHPRVQNAVRTTILGLIGSLPKLAFDTTTITTGERLASLMFQLQMTGYMFKNAEYRLSLTQSLGMANGASSPSSEFLLTGSSTDEDEQDEKLDPLKGKVKGKLKIRYGGGGDDSVTDVNATASTSAEQGLELEVDAAAYLTELRSEVSKLRDDLAITRKAKEEALRKDLLTYIRTLPPQQLQSLTNTMSQDVLVAMKGLVNVVMAGIGDGKIEADTVTEQSGESMAQLCMWQLVVGYNLREMEVREEMKKSLASRFGVGNLDDGGVDFSEPGALD